MLYKYSAPVALTAFGLILAGCYTPPEAAPAAPPGYSGSASGAYGPSTYAPSAPPSPIVEVVPPSPNTMVYWQPGHWGWTGTQWTWVSGGYAERPRVQAVWVPGHWQPNGSGYMWMDGQWQ